MPADSRCCRSAFVSQALSAARLAALGSPSKGRASGCLQPVRPSDESGRAYLSGRPERESWCSIHRASTRSPVHLFFRRTGGMLVGTHNRTVNEDVRGRTSSLPPSTFSRSASSASSASTACHISRDHLAKRWHALFPGPKSGGKSRHRLPVRTIHSTASTNSRLHGSQVTIFHARVAEPLTPIPSPPHPPVLKKLRQLRTYV